MGYVVDGPVGKNAAKSVVSESKEKTDGFKKGGSCMKKGGMAKRKARASGGGVMSSAASGTPRGKTPKPY